MSGRFPWRLRPRPRAALAVLCAEVREAISARLDGEDPPVPDRAVDTHLASCASCRDFEANLATLNRQLRLHVVEASPELSPAILASLGFSELAAVPDETTSRQAMRDHPPWRQRARLIASVVPLAIVVPAFALGSFTDVHITPSHAVSPCTRALVHHVGANERSDWRALERSGSLEMSSARERRS